MNHKLRLLLALLAIAGLTQGCNVQPHNVRLAPSVKVQPSELGQNKVVGLEVVDSRADKKLGVVGDPQGKFVYLTLASETPPTIYKQVAEGLEKLGFTVQPATGSEERSLKVDVTELSYEAVKKPTTFDTVAKVSLAATARTEAQTYERAYNVKQEKAAGAPPNASDDERIVNSLVSMALEDMLTDKQLLALLAK
jgi:uncharacterized lipoprotein YajG